MCVRRMIATHKTEIGILLVQLLAFYVMPLLAGPTDAMGMVFLLIMLTFALSLILGMMSRNKVKYLYPLAAAIGFIPSVFLYYNESALIHALWYLAISAVGLVIGVILRFILTAAGTTIKGGRN